MRAKANIILTMMLLFPLTLPAAGDQGNEQVSQPQQKYIIRPPTSAGAAISVAARSTRQIPIQVTDENDKPVPDLPIEFALASNSFGFLASRMSNQPRLRAAAFTRTPFATADALVAQASVYRTRTDRAGKASARFIAGSALGEVSIKVSIEGTETAWEGTILIVERLGDKEADQPPAAGVLMGSGSLEVNGNPARAGLTVFGGSTIATGADSHASVEWPGLGRILLEEKTKAKIEIGNQRMVIDFLECGDLSVDTAPGVACTINMLDHNHAKVSVQRGSVQTKGKNKQTLFHTGDEETVKDLLEVSSTGDAAFEVSCGGRRIWPFLLPPAAIIIPIVKQRGGDERPPFLSQVTP